MVQVGFTIESYKGLEPSFLLGIVKYFGVELVEITKTVFEEIDQVVPRMQGLKAGFHLPLVHDDNWDFSCEDYQAEIDELIDKINRYRDKLHIAYCISHPPEPWNNQKQIRSSLDLLLKNLDRLEVPIFFENVPYGPHDEYVEMYRQAKNKLGSKLSGMCFDGPHYFVSGMDPVKQLLDLNGEIGCVHLSDCKQDDDSHLPFDSGGELPTTAILQNLKKLSYDGYINLEIKPRSLSDLTPVIDSYLKVLKHFRVTKYYRTKARLFFLRPLMKRLLDPAGES